MRSVTPLPADLNSWDPGRLAAACNERRAIVDEFSAIVAAKGTLTADQLTQFRSINDDLDRVTDINPHPGHIPQRRESRAARDATGFGRLRGLGAEFIRGVGGGGKMMAAIDGTSGGTMVSPFYDRQIRDLPQRQLFVRSLIPTTLATGDKIWYLRQSVATQNAAAVAAHGLKPTSVFTVERIEETISTIAHVSEATDRALLSDFDALADFIDGQLRLGVLLEEEDQILNGSGAGANLTGILNTAGIQTQAKGADPTPDAIHKAVTKIRTQFLEPDGIVIHPNDWQDIRLLRTADGTYIFGAPADTAPERIWGLQVVTSTLIAEGTALVGAFGVASQVWDREQARVTFAETGLSDAAGQDMFLQNEIRFRGESRIAFGVIRPAAFCTVTGI